MWTDEGQERAVARRQGRLEANAKANTTDPEPPETIKASGGIALLPQSEIRTEPYTHEQRVADGQKSAAERWRRENEDVRVQAHRHLAAQFLASTSLIKERLGRGDPIVDATGKITGYRPVRLRDLDNLQASTVDRMLALEKRILGEDSGEPAEGSDKVERLLVRLELIGREKPLTGQVRGEFREPKVIDVEENT